MSIIIANWKMNMNLSSGCDLVRKVLELVSQEKIEDSLVICPPFTMLDRVYNIINNKGIYLGAQDCAIEPFGARTGDISAGMLKDVGCGYVILGHSERRKFHNETPPIIRKKVELAHIVGLKTVICIGETAEERANGLTLDVISDQLTKIIPEDGVLSENILIAYEPLWSVGTGITPSAEEINQIGEYCAGIFATRFSFEKKIKFLYGGSVDGSNCVDILQSEYLDGVLVGGAGLDFNKFSEVLMAANRTCKQY
ncbi:MAG: triose-phosphate isomerase [Alphaproteobacteria bacterium]|nr:triose-phosphate isomerase [Alphaproteobacteria bacterium]